MRDEISTKAGVVSHGNIVFLSKCFRTQCWAINHSH